MAQAIQELIAKAFSVGAPVNPGLLFALTLFAIAILVGAVAAASKKWAENLIQKYLAPTIVFAFFPIAAYAYGYYWSLGALALLGVVTALLVWCVQSLRSRSWIPALVALIPFALVARWEQGYLERQKETSEPPTVAVLMFENRSLTAPKTEIDNAWAIFVEELSEALDPVKKVRVHPLRQIRNRWQAIEISIDNALDQLKTLSVYPDVVIVTEIKPDADLITLWQKVYEVTGRTTKAAFQTPAETADKRQYLQLAQRQTMMILPYLTGEVVLTQEELQLACATVLQRHVSSLQAGPRLDRLQPMVGTCPGIPKLAEILKDGLLPANAGQPTAAARTANVNTAVAAVSTAFGGSE
jgi:hypothetical protein